MMDCGISDSNYLSTDIIGSPEDDWSWMDVVEDVKPNPFECLNTPPVSAMPPHPEQNLEVAPHPPIVEPSLPEVETPSTSQNLQPEAQPFIVDEMILNTFQSTNAAGLVLNWKLIELRPRTLPSSIIYWQPTLIDYQGAYPSYTIVTNPELTAGGIDCIGIPNDALSSTGLLGSISSSEETEKTNEMPGSTVSSVGSTTASGIPVSSVGSTTASGIPVSSVGSTTASGIPVSSVGRSTASGIPTLRISNGRCKFCQKVFKQPFMLLRHKKIHEGKPGDELLRCKICNCPFKFQVSLTKHVKHYHSEQNKAS